MDGGHEFDPCPGQSKGNRQMANKLPDLSAAKPQPKRKICHQDTKTPRIFFIKIFLCASWCLGAFVATFLFFARKWLCKAKKCCYRPGKGVVKLKSGVAGREMGL
jgi:hypothetical protein